MNTNDIENRIKFLSENDNINWTQQGWQCPVCKAVMSPTTSVCVNCRGVGHEVVVNTLPSIQPSIEQYIDWSKQTSGTRPQDYGVITTAHNNDKNESYAEAHVKERE